MGRHICYIYEVAVTFAAIITHHTMKHPEIKLTTDEAELNNCARLMSSSEPFVSLKFEYEKCKLAVRGDYKEVYVATLGDECVGFVVLQFYGLLRGYIQTICVEPAHRGKGIGTSLLKFSEEKISRIFPNVFMCVTSFNEKAQKLYYSLGYEKVGVLKDHIIYGADEYLLRKQFSPTSEFKPVA
jgi:[ribosomal protein S18]-alanine N-acetyltransferase